MHERVRRAARAAGRAAAALELEPARDPLPAGRAARRARAIYGVEALLRWQHPTRGMIPPAQLHPARRGDRPDHPDRPLGPAGGLPRGGASCTSGSRATPPLTMSVNLSVKQLQSETIVADVREALESSGLPPSSLVLEITESVMMADTELAVRRLQDLKSLGVLLAMDDFGTGYSSLSYLSRFPVDILKMDRSFLAPGARRLGPGRGDRRARQEPRPRRGRRGHRAPRADRLAARPRLRARPGLPVRQADGRRGALRSTSSTRRRMRSSQPAAACSIVTRRSTAPAAFPG